MIPVELERVSVSLDVAGAGTRVLAWLVDFLVLFFSWTALFFLATLFGRVELDRFADLAGVLQALLVLAAFAVQWGYWIAFELLWRGQSPGKRLLKLRVVTLEGRPVGFFESALRNVARTADFLPFGYALGLLTMASNERSRRLGDLLAGTVVIRERRVDLSRYDAAATARAVDAEEFELLADFLARRQWLSPAARERVALELAAHFAERQSQPPPANAAEAEARLERLVGERRG